MPPGADPDPGGQAAQVAADDPTIPADRIPTDRAARADTVDLALEHRGARLVHLAVTLTGGLADADALLRAALRRGSWQPGPGRVTDPDRAHEWVRRLVVAEFLSWRWVGRGRRGVSRPGVSRRTDADDVGTADWHRVHAPFRGRRRQWVVLVLRYGQGLDDVAIGHALGCPTGVVTHTAARALARLGRGVPGPEDAVRTAQATLATAPGSPEGRVSQELLAWLRADRARPAGHRYLAAAAVLAALSVVAAMLWWPRATDSAATVPGPGTAMASVAPTPAAAAARAAGVLARYRAAVAAAAPPKLLVIGPVWEAVPPAGAQLVRGRLRDEMPPIDDRAAVGTVRSPDGRESMTPVLGLHETFAELARAATPCPRCPPVVAVSGRLVAMTVRTPAGRAVVPGQEFAFRATSVRVRRLAIPASSLVALPPMPGGQQYAALASGQVVGAAVVARRAPARVPSRAFPTSPGVPEAAASRVVSVTVAGAATRERGCRPPRVTVVEADDAVAVAVSPADPTASRDAGSSCDPRGRTLTLTLAEPLGTRVLLDVATGRPVPVPVIPGG